MTAATRGSVEPEIVSAGLRQRVARYIAAAGGKELGFLLAGRADPRVATDVFPFIPQSTSVTSFQAAPAAVRAAVAAVRQAGLDLLGVLHLHPGGKEAAFHSQVDEENLSDRLLPLLSTTVAREVYVEGTLAGALGKHRDLDVLGAAKSFDGLGLRMRELRATMTSLVVASDLSLYALRLRFRSVPVLDLQQPGRTLSLVEREEPEVQVRTEEELGLPPPVVASAAAIAHEVSEKILVAPATLRSEQASGLLPSSEALLDAIANLLAGIFERHADDAVVAQLVGVGGQCVGAIRARLAAREPAEAAVGAPCV